ncbi:MAG: DUF4160 domain-containing protein [Myxococcales bacterium]|nr:DUF4160 domain-containing protein [Myxococcales bacterium]
MYDTNRWRPTATTAFRQGAFEFWVNTRETEYEPPHVHIWFADAGTEARITLTTSDWMDKQPPKAAQGIQIFLERREELVALWNKIHTNRQVQ